MRHLLSSRGRTALLALVLLVCNVYVVARLFGTEYLPHMHSIEAAYISLTRHILAHGSEMAWYPYWEAGEPFTNTYQPGLPLISAAIALLLQVSSARAYHVAIALLYCLGPIGIYFLAKSLTGRRDVGFMAGLAASLLSPSAWLVATVRLDMGSIWYDRRYMALLYYGEGPNVAGLSLVPWAWWGLHRLWTQWSGPRLATAALACALVVIVSWPAGVTMVLGALCYLLAQSWPVLRARVWRVAALGLLAYGLIAVWVPISTIRDNQRNSQMIGGDYHYTHKHLLYWGVVLVVLVLLRVLLRRALLIVQFSTMLFWLLGAVALGAYWFHIALMPQPERFHLAMEFPLFLLAGTLWFLIPRRREIQIGAAVLLLLFGLYQARRIRHFNKGLTGSIDITKTLEYQTSLWLAQHRPGERTLAAGSVAFWMDAWNDIPQVTGCCLPGLPNPVEWIVGYVVSSDDGLQGREAEASLLWLRAFGARTVVMGGDHTRNAYHDWHTPRKFEGVLPKIREDGDDRIYEIPSRTAGLWHVVPADRIVAREPVNGLDLEPLRPFVNALENPALPVPDMRWANLHEMDGQAQFQPGQVLHIQETYTPGWRATVNGEPRTVQRDGLGLMTINPAPLTGPAEIRLWWDGGAELLLARIYTALAWLTLVSLLLLRRVLKVR